MLKKISIVLLACLSFSTFANHNTVENHKDLYDKLNLKEKISEDVFFKAIKKHDETASTDKNIISIIDFGKPSTVKRLAIVDLDKEELLFNEYVAHGQGSGGKYANKFSNTINSHQSSLGQYKTAETYYGKHGYSLKLDGKDKTNSQARDRYIVIHGADYANESFIKKTGRLGRSWGCPALDKKVAKKVIDTIKNGTYLYAYN